MPELELRPPPQPSLADAHRRRGMSERRDGFARPNESPNGSSDDSRVARLNGRTAQRFIREETVRLEAEWKRDERWTDITRPYGAADVVRLRGSIVPECTLARVGAEKLW